MIKFILLLTVLISTSFGQSAGAATTLDFSFLARSVDGSPSKGVSIGLKSIVFRPSRHISAGEFEAVIDIVRNGNCESRGIGACDATLDVRNLRAAFLRLLMGIDKEKLSGIGIEFASFEKEGTENDLQQFEGLDFMNWQLVLDSKTFLNTDKIRLVIKGTAGAGWGRVTSLEGLNLAQAVCAGGACRARRQSAEMSIGNLGLDADLKLANVVTVTGRIKNRYAITGGSLEDEENHKLYGSKGVRLQLDLGVLSKRLRNVSVFGSVDKYTRAVKGSDYIYDSEISAPGLEQKDRRYQFGVSIRPF